MEYKALGERIILKREIAKEENEFLKEKTKDNIGILISVGQECPSYLTSLEGKHVMFATSAAENLGNENGYEYLLLHKSALLAY